jgi:RNA polymerase sigma factor (sigma-70 family)
VTIKRSAKASAFEGAKKAPKLKLIKNGSVAVKKSAKSARPMIRAVKNGELTPYQQEALIMKYRAKARKLGRSMLRRWHARMDLDEVDSIVDLSLCEAVKRFDPYKGASFMTFLFYHLKGNLVRSVTQAAAATAIPLAFAELANSAFSDEEHGPQVTLPINAIELAEALSSQDIPLPDEAVWKKELHSKSLDACDKLDDLEREIVKRIFVHEQQIIDIAAALGYSRCHISRVKKKALDTLHDELSVIMNREDFGPYREEQEEESEEILERVASRKEIHRRKPRSAVNHGDVAARAA